MGGRLRCFFVALGKNMQRRSCSALMLCVGGCACLFQMLYDELVALGVLRTYPKHTPIHRDSANSWFVTQQLQQYHAQDHKEDVEDNSSSGASKTPGDCKTMSTSDSKWQLETPDTKPHPMPLDRSQSMSIGKALQPQPSASAVEADSPSITEDWKEHQVEVCGSPFCAVLWGVTCVLCFAQFYDTVEGPPPSTALVPLALYRAFRSVTLQLQSTGWKSKGMPRGRKDRLTRMRQCRHCQVWWKHRLLGASLRGHD